ncbi:hypothetical protein ACH5RR_003089 [Cinchona calisaya]|uniref:Uncharacterized protein n=1 Tax=Cinchona calisaya TaxID=153742 RepID=A0ABD3ATY5_9GENT
MKFELKQAIEHGVLTNEAAICAKHLGTTVGYINGKGYDPKPPKKKVIFNNHATFNLRQMKDIVIEKSGMTLSTLYSNDESGDVNDARMWDDFKAFIAF